ncbi:Spo0E family sporulation regulatory protein-aspartic acid phosphatase [Peribacillus sp. SCS-37]|uniref:Spo0E family sporulation regulatory protein-aspartic acid phosphatase n=2 Tax=Paraperibacillus TaxID=3450404 RepID=UPI003905B022
MLTKSDLETRIEAIRNKMIRSAAKTGLHSRTTIALSQQLDGYIVLYQGLQKDYSRTS